MRGDGKPFAAADRHSKPPVRLKTVGFGRNNRRSGCGALRVVCMLMGFEEVVFTSRFLYLVKGTFVQGVLTKSPEGECSRIPALAVVPRTTFRLKSRVNVKEVNCAVLRTKVGVSGVAYTNLSFRRYEVRAATHSFRHLFLRTTETAYFSTMCSFFTMFSRFSSYFRQRVANRLHRECPISG